jgi:hypothetical protein
VSHIVAHLDSLQAKVDRLKAPQAQTAAELEARLPSILGKAFKGGIVRMGVYSQIAAPNLTTPEKKSIVNGYGELSEKIGHLKNEAYENIVPLKMFITNGM